MLPDKRAWLKTSLQIAMWASIISLLMWFIVMMGYYVFKAAFRYVPSPGITMTAEDCKLRGVHTGYDTELDAGVCWVTMEHGVTLPWSDAVDLIKFRYTNSVVAGDPSAHTNAQERTLGK